MFFTDYVCKGKFWVGWGELGLVRLSRDAHFTCSNPSSPQTHQKLTCIQLVCLIFELLVSLWGDCRMNIHRKGGPGAGQISTMWNKMLLSINLNCLALWIIHLKSLKCSLKIFKSLQMVFQANVRSSSSAIFCYPIQNICILTQFHKAKKYKQ